MIAIVQKLLSEVNGMKVALAALSIILTRRRRSSLGKAFIAFRERQVEKDEVKLRGGSSVVNIPLRLICSYLGL